jgi:putative acetyltransferase
MMVIRKEAPSDFDQIAALLDLAFGGNEESRLVEGLRAEGAVIAALVAVENGRVLGHVLFSELPIETARGALRAAALAPLAILPECQRRGIGTALARAGLAACRERGVAAVVVLGDPDYYPRFDFSAETARNLRAPFRGPAFMAVELTPGCLAGVTGTVRYAEAFGLNNANT